MLFIANRSFVLAHSRWKILSAFLKSGWSVVAACENDSRSKQLRDLGCEIQRIPFPSGGIMIWRELWAFFRLAHTIREQQPDLVHSFNIRPIVMGNLLTRLLLGAEPIVISTVTGMGYVAGGRSLTRFFVDKLYSVALGLGNLTIFQNNSDREEFCEWRIVSDQRSRVIVGSGVDTTRFVPETRDRSKSLQRVIYVGRLLWQKGFREFVEAARAMKMVDDGISFDVFGELAENHPDGVPRSFLENCIGKGEINYHGFQETPEEIYQNADVLLFLSSYGEGVPRVVLEASASGVVPVVRASGWVKDVIKSGESGFVLGNCGTDHIVNLLTHLNENREELRRISENARREMVSRFEEDEITVDYLNIYRSQGLEVLEDGWTDRKRA